MSVHDEGNLDESNFDDRHFDEVDAVRRFPSEKEWLDLPAPNLGSTDLGSTDHSSADHSSADHSSKHHSSADQNTADQNTAPAETRPPEATTSFVDRVMRARQEEQAIDAQLAELDKALPNEWLQQLAAPTPSASFVDDTVATVMNDRRNRWQQMLSRHVAPEPSPAFVTRTLEALRDGAAAAQNHKSAARQAAETGSSKTGSSKTGSSKTGSSKTGSSPTRTSPTRTSPAHTSPAQLPYTPLQGNRSNWPVFSLVAAAAAAILWLLLTDAARLPLEVRLADQTSPAVAYGEATTPMSAILARVAHDEEPFAVFDAPADGLWLVSTTEDRTTGELR